MHILPIAVVVMLAGASNSAQASFLQLSHEPLFLDQSVPPAIAVTLDDSGSMFWSFMGPSGSNGTDFTNPLENTLYFNPNIEYTPPLRADGSQMPDSNPSSAWVDGYPNNMNDTVDLTDDYIAIRRIVYNRFDDNVRIGFVDTQERDIGDINALYQNYHPDWTGDRAYYSVPDGTGGYDTVFLYGADLQNFANWYSYYNSRAKLARAAISRAFSGFGPNFKIAWQELNRNTTFSNLSKFEQTHKQNFFNWLFKAPTSGGTPLRSAFKRAGDLFELDSSYFSTDFNTNLSCQQNFHIAISDGGWNSDGGYNTGTNGFAQDETALAGGLPGDTDNLYTGYTGGGEQIIYSKAEGGSTLSDIAFDSWARDLNPNLNNNVKRFKKDFTDRNGNDIDFSAVTDEWENAAFMWNPNNDPAYWQHLVTYNVGMGLQASRIRDYEAGNFGNCPNNGIADPKEAVFRSLRNGACAWPDATNDNNKIDDVWHSSINSRGDFFSANDPRELVEALNTVVNNILERISRGSSSTVSSGVVTDDTRVYSPGFDSSTWSGNLIAREVNDDRTFGDAIWDASCILTGGECAATGETVAKQATRNIFTFDPLSNTQVRFDTSLPTPLRAVMELNAEEMITNLGVSSDEIIEYILGDQSNEQANAGVFRDRVSVLADIVHGSPYIVRGPSAAYEDSLWGEGTDELAAADNGNGYLDFQIAQKDRNNTVYVGSNGGMLHAFNAEGPQEGRERWAFMPSKAFENITRLPDPSQGHWSYVDNTPVVRDAFVNGAWRSILVSGMRYGGQAFFAIDVTNGSSNQPEVMWEFTDQDDPDMGYSYGQATIAKISSTGDWVALIPNGYNNSEPDFADATDPRNRVSATGNAVLFVVRLSDGQLLTKLDTGVGSANTPNGLATVVAIDSEFVTPPNESSPRTDYGADFAYGGDLYGNLWRFDFRDPSPSSWSIKRIVAADGIMDRPITIQPKVVAVPDGIQSTTNDLIVMFGTGKYLEPSDRSISLPATQYMVGVIDGLDSPDSDLSINSGRFIEQTFSTAGGGFIRNLSANDVDHANDYGWKVKLAEQGERVFNPLALFGSQILLATSNVTAGTDPCEAGGRSWLMAFNPYTGGLPTVGNIFKDVQVVINGQLTDIDEPGTGVLIQDFVIGKPKVTECQGGACAEIYAEGVNAVTPISLQKFTWRRRNWTNLLTE